MPSRVSIKGCGEFLRSLYLTVGARRNGRAGDQVLVEVRAAGIGYAIDLGRLALGYEADLLVIDGDRSKPYESIVTAWPSTIKRVMIAGYVLYGDKSLADMANGGVCCERRDVCGNRKFMCVATAQRRGKLEQTLADIEANLNAGLKILDAVEVFPLTNCEYTNPDDGNVVKPTCLRVRNQVVLSSTRQVRLMRQCGGCSYANDAMVMEWRWNGDGRDWLGGWDQKPDGAKGRTVFRSSSRKRSCKPTK